MDMESWTKHGIELATYVGTLIGLNAFLTKRLSSRVKELENKKTVEKSDCEAAMAKCPIKSDIAVIKTKIDAMSKASDLEREDRVRELQNIHTAINNIGK